MTIQRYSISATSERFNVGAYVSAYMDAEGKYCLYADVYEKIKIGEEAKQIIDKIQVLLELSQRREKILMELLDEAYKKEITQ